MIAVIKAKLIFIGNTLKVKGSSFCSRVNCDLVENKVVQHKIYNYLE